MRLHPLRRLSRIALSLLHWLAHLSHGLLVLVIVLLIGSAWRLSQGPVNMSWLTARLEASFNTPGSSIQLHIGHTALAWEGFRFGADRPIDLRLTDVRLTDAARHQSLTVPQAELSLSLAALLIGRLQPRAIELDRPRLTFRRAGDGSITLDLGDLAPASAAGQDGDPLPALLAELARPPANDRERLRGWISQIRRVRIHDAAIMLQDQQLGVAWRAPRAEIDLVRKPDGGVSGSADLSLAFGAQRVRLQLSGALSAGAAQTRLTAHLTPLNPASLATLVPRLASLAAINAPVGVDATLLLGPQLAVRHAHLSLLAGSGTVHIGDSDEPLQSASLDADGTLQALRITAAEAKLQARADGPVTTLRASGAVQRNAGRIDATLSLHIDQVAFPDLSILWPKGVGGNSRDWVTQNITAGLAQDGKVQVALQAKDDLSDLTLTSASGTLDGTGLTVHWLRPVPPIENGRAQLRILGPDTLEIAVQGGVQELPAGSGTLTLQSGSMRITGLMQPEQVGDIQAQISGSLPDALTMLREKRLKLLAVHPLPLRDPAGQVSVALSVRLPLNNQVEIDQIAIHTTAQLDGVHLSNVVAGQSLDQGKLQLDATGDGMTVKGTAELAGIPARLQGVMDFRAGDAQQVLQRFNVSGRPSVRQLAAVGLDASDVLSGPVPMQVEYSERRSGLSTVTVHADLTPTTMTLAPLNWRKPAGHSAEASTTLRLMHDRLAGISRLSVVGDDIAVQGSAECSNGRVSLLRLDKVVFGRNDLSATVRLPPGGGSPIVVDASGRVLDLSARLERKHQPTPPASKEPPPGPPWTLHAHFDRVLMANGTALAPVNVQVENDGRVFRRLYASGDARDKDAFDVRLTPDGAGRRLVINAGRAGDLLRALGWMKELDGGRLSVTGTYDDSKPGHPLNAIANLSAFRVREAVGLGKLLQAMTLYGLVDALRGPGLSFSQAVIPFRLTGQVLDIGGARAFSASLGLTAKGNIDLNAARVDMQGTIVPAYFFNSLLGRVPVLGKLLSPEKGGGVFAASYTLRGRLDDPDVSVNPLTALTPGILRGLFGMF